MKPDTYIGIILSIAFVLLTGCGDSGVKPSPSAQAVPATPDPVKAQDKATGTETPKADAPKESTPAATKPADSPPAKSDAKADAKPSAPGTTVTFGKENGPQNSMVIPAEWKQETPANNMRLLQVKIPKKLDDADDGELMVFKFGGGGGVDANLKRWAGQMGGEDSMKLQRTLKTSSGKEATIAEFEGTYTAMTAGAAPKSGYKMLGAIIITDAGEVYVKVAGPFNTIDGSKAEFDKMIESFK